MSTLPLSFIEISFIKQCNGTRLLCLVLSAGAFTAAAAVSLILMVSLYVALLLTSAFYLRLASFLPQVSVIPPQLLSALLTHFILIFWKDRRGSRQIPKNLDSGLQSNVGEIDNERSNVKS